ncbi:MAG: ATP-binding cassette domain-containing protein [Planctomycetes bacterium]|nr:ATP-binding cassette domain-containing protein [Planctomycetota bacterium]
MIKVEHIYKRYGATIAVNNASFEVKRGEIVGFLGPNGAGKSTCLKIVTCYIVADSGRVVVDGLDVLENSLEVRRRIGYLPESTPVYPDMEVGEYLRFMARARQLSPAQSREAIARVVELTGIERMMKKTVTHLSKGYKQRVGIAQSLMHDPPVIIMDEPTSGLDPHQIIEIRELIRELGKSKVIVLSSHILQEISAICTRILIIKEGRIVANGTPAELQTIVSDRSIFDARLRGDESAVGGALRGIAGVESVEVVAQADGFTTYRVTGRRTDRLGCEIFALAKEGGWELSSLSPLHDTLEDVYLQLTARGEPTQAA